MAARSLTIVHCNDVYELPARQQDPCGGAARFAALVKSFSALNPLVLFSGEQAGAWACSRGAGVRCRAARGALQGASRVQHQTAHDAVVTPLWVPLQATHTTPPC